MTSIKSESENNLGAKDLIAFQERLSGIESRINSGDPVTTDERDYYEAMKQAIAQAEIDIENEI
ncbi:hypothetical protein [Aeromonas veronii]|uniref:hypothetical protein n=1 Tax=Aeromonas veronii TaxID=654 RepID=UPI003BA12848